MNLTHFGTNALAAALALAAGSAQATLQRTDTGSGSVVLAVWDDVRQVSYVRDLGINLLDFPLAASPNPLQQGASAGLGQPIPPRLFATDALFGTTFAGSTASNIRWGVGAGDRTAPTNLFATRALGNLPAGTAFGATGLNGISNNMDGVFDSANIFHEFLGPFTSYATDASVFNTGRSVNSGRLFGTPPALGPWFGTIGDHMAFFNYRATTATAGVFFNTGTMFHLDLAGNLTHYVPVPAAVWLLGSALVGMAGVARRRVD